MKHSKYMLVMVLALYCRVAGGQEAKDLKGATAPSSAALVPAQSASVPKASGLESAIAKSEAATSSDGRNMFFDAAPGSGQEASAGTAGAETPGELPGFGDPLNVSLGFGWWGTSTSGSKVKTGEFQDLDPSPFWNIDGLYTNGVRTLDFYTSGTDNEGSQARVEFFGPRVHAEAEFQRYLRRLDHVPLTNFRGARGILNQDLNVGDDYAIRVDEFRTEIGGNLTENVKLRVDVWSQRKFGERQANALAHCFAAAGVSGRNCHILSQRQEIDWLTTEVTPRLEGRFGPFTIEYSRPMRQFTQNDQVVTRSYTGLAPQIISGTYPYAIVPESMTQIDQLKVGVDLGPTRRFYTFGYFGQTENQFRNVQRDFYGYDVRFTDWTIQGVNLTAYAKGYHQNGQRPPFFLPDERQFLTLAQTEDAIRDPIEYHRTSAGAKGRWRPGIGGPALQGLALTGGYEYDILGRDFALYEQSDEAFTFEQPDTITHTLHAGVQQPWGSTVDTFVRYKLLFIDGPMYGFRETSGVLNSSQPERKHIVEVGGGWYPTPNFAVTAEQDFDLRRHFADISEVPGNVVDFNEESYSSMLTMWYAPTQKLSMTTGAAHLANWINQNITLGDDYIEPGTPPGPLLPPLTRRWFYGGIADVVHLRFRYLLTDCVRLSCGYEYVHGRNRFDNRNFSDRWPDLPQYSDVVVDTNEVTAGVDWQPRDLLNLYFRYIFFDYDDKTAAYNSGTAHMFLAGFSLYR